MTGLADLDPPGVGWSRGGRGGAGKHELGAVGLIDLGEFGF